jgi:hypothetical protein
MIYVSDIEEIKQQLLEIFPDAIRGSVAKSKWGNGRRLLHLSYFFGGDTAGGYAIQGKGNLYYFIEWDTNDGFVYIFAESDIDAIIARVKKMFHGQVFNIDRPVVF